MVWVPVKAVVNNYSLTFDHQHILNVCYERLQNKVQYTSLPIHLLPDSFTLTELQTTFEIILEKTVEKKSFRRRILEANIIEETGDMRTGNSRPAKLYRLRKESSNHYFTRNIEGPR
ncbi:hypothetical protein ACFOEK_04945 [Litoribrevibacter euphylliae]|uniref:NrtR DNA-binding winged helix domain-containing protein n=1 Tax=Litoribrevibacter euphylliae TaxID=1834034 RepID=A0ABV7H8Z2_9GAMM